MAAACMGVSLGMFFLLTNAFRSFILGKKKVLIYSLVNIIAFALVALLGIKGLISLPVYQYLLFHGCFLLLGILHVRLMYVYFDFSDRKKSFFPELLFTLYLMVLGLVPFFLIYRALNDEGYHYFMAASTICFLIPLFVHKTFEASVDIPLRVLKKWFYPMYDSIPDPTTEELRNPYVVSFVFHKKEDDKKYTHFRAKAPAYMTMERLFYHFMDDYNTKNAEGPIEYADKYGKPYGWIFYFRPRWYLFFAKRYIDPQSTIGENKIRENSVIICVRENEDGNTLQVLSA